MFTGIIEEVGEIQSIKKGANSAVITIKASTVLGDLHLGDSVALNGVCLTAVSIGKNNYSVDVMHETLRRTNLGELKSGFHSRQSAYRIPFPCRPTDVLADIS